VATPTFHAWHGETAAAAALEATLAVLAAIASQAFHVTGREAPPALVELLAETRRHVPPVRGPRPLGPEVEALAEALRARVLADVRVGEASVAD
jgi:histidine ammonia-lyase